LTILDWQSPGEYEPQTRFCLEGKLEITRQMKADGEPLEKIIRYTGLSGEEIERI
jgi:hypothetical protein